LTKGEGKEMNLQLENFIGANLNTSSHAPKRNMYIDAWSVNESEINAPNPRHPRMIIITDDKL